MEKKVYHLSSCSTCQRIIKELGIGHEFTYQDIKTQTITAQQLNDMAQLTGSYEALFSRRAIKYKSMGLKDKKLTEENYRDLILEEYTFLKRPVFIIGKEIFVGNAKKTVMAIKEALEE